MLTGTAHFSIAEALDASGGSIPDALADNAQAVLEWLESARVYLGRPIIITSLYRSQAHNATVPGHASNSEHMQALGADFDVLGMTNSEALALLVQGVSLGAVPAYHQLITYTTDHHLHVGIAGSAPDGSASWNADGQNLLETSVGEYATLSDADVVGFLSPSMVQTAGALAAQAVDVAKLHPAVVLLVIGLFLAPALFGGHWTV